MGRGAGRARPLDSSPAAPVQTQGAPIHGAWLGAPAPLGCRTACCARPGARWALRRARAGVRGLGGRYRGKNRGKAVPGARQQGAQGGGTLVNGWANHRASTPDDMALSKWGSMRPARALPTGRAAHAMAAGRPGGGQGRRGHRRRQCGGRAGRDWRHINRRVATQVVWRVGSLCYPAGHVSAVNRRAAPRTEGGQPRRQAGERPAGQGEVSELRGAVGCRALVALYTAMAGAGNGVGPHGARPRGP